MRVGIVSPPAWFDTGAQQFAALAGDSAEVAQTILHVPGFPYTPPAMRALLPRFGEAAAMLSDAGADVIGLSGSQFTLVHATDLSVVDRFHAATEDALAGPVVMMADSMVTALQDMGLASISLATAYYTPEFTDLARAFFTARGITVTTAFSWVDQGLFADQAAVDAMDWHYSADLAHETLRRLPADARAADAVVIPGASLRMLTVAPAWEAAIGRPIIGADAAFLRALLRTADPAWTQRTFRAGALFA